VGAKLLKHDARMYEFLDRHPVFCMNWAGSQEKRSLRHRVSTERRLIDVLRSSGECLQNQVADTVEANEQMK
jgi:hypothetical protein